MSLDVTDAYQRIMGFSPNPMQEAVFEKFSSGDFAFLLKAPTGSGKTESVLVPALAHFLDGGEPRRLFLILPARSLVDDQVERISAILERLSSQEKRSLALVVDTGAQSYRQVWKDGKSEKQYRHLYDGDVIITTLDKFLYRFFAFGEPYKNYVFPLRIHYGAKRPLFCFDEAHTYEDVAFTNFVNLAYALSVEHGHDIVVMTATMPDSYASQLNFLDTIDFVQGQNLEHLRAFQKHPHEGKKLEYHPTEEKQLIPGITLLAEQAYTPGKRVIVTLEQVKDAVQVFGELRKKFGENVLLYHGRIPDIIEGKPESGRAKVYRELKKRDQTNQSYLLVTTSAIEVGCDLNADTLITEICNPDQLVQRAGRCNRRGQIPDARVIVVGNKIKPFFSDLDEDSQNEYVKILKEMDGKDFDPSRILSCLRVKPMIDYRVQKMFDMLYEYVYEANQVYKGLHEKGLVITRSWEPSVTICTGFQDARPLNAVSVNIRSLIAYDGKTDPGCVLYRRYYEGDESHRYKIEEVKHSGCAYLFDLYLQVPDSFFDPVTGYKDVPKVFTRQYAGSGYRERVQFESQPDGVASDSSVEKKKSKTGKGASKPSSPSFWYLKKMEIVSESEESEQAVESSEEDSDE
jgi:CRISPR-associated endonuclease/helicase Cas3